ncbi:berberine bridge enzyme-like 4 [Cucurbita moschata]|uniref:Berberine bridge enzyme-like 4 n=1 Tax=Cucurbita moschata TaxID=3662 RepID=A0A6J1EES3_CUCMO|nr:berberine bridge enzyme-like 4 [Cucurbita moschata]
MSPLPLILLLSLPLAFSYETEGSPVQSFVDCLPIHASPSIHDVIYTPQNTSFLSILQSYNRNLRFETPQTPNPVLIITPLDATQVQATIACANPLGLQLRVRSGGHDYEGLSYQAHVPFVLLDMFNLRKIDIYKDGYDYVAWIEAGAILGELYHRIAEFSPNLAFPGGVCFTLGVGGHFSGGGYGNLMRKYGLSVDNIVDALFVDATGAVLDRKSMGEDLFWAIRGGGAASFGVVISWKIKLVSVPETVTVFNVNLRPEQGALDVAHRWQFVAPNLPDELFIRLMHTVVGSTTEKGELTVQASFVGLFLGTPKSLIPIMNKNFPELGLKQSDCREVRWVESTIFWYKGPIGSNIDILLERPKNGSYFFKGRSDYVKKAISKEGIQGIWRTMVGLNSTSLTMQWNPYGGRMWEISESATPFPHRAGNLYLIQYTLSWMKQGMESTNHYMNISRSLYEYMTPLVSSSPRESFLNYRDLEIGANPSTETNYMVAEEYGRKYFKGNFDRLMKVKTMVDPHNFFRNEQSIPPLPKQRVSNTRHDC